MNKLKNRQIKINLRNVHVPVVMHHSYRKFDAGIHSYESNIQSLLALY